MDYFKQLRKSKRWIILNKEPFAIFSLFSIFAMTFIIPNIIIAIGLTYSLVNLTRIIFFFIWLWFISPIDKTSKKEREIMKKWKVEVVKAVEKAIGAYENKFKWNAYLSSPIIFK